jgi:hypothetical protein
MFRDECDCPYDMFNLQKVYGKHIACFALIRLICFVAFIVCGYIYDVGLDESMIGSFVLIGFACFVGFLMGVLHVTQSDYFDSSLPGYTINVATYYLINYLISLFCIFTIIINNDNDKWGYTSMLNLATFVLMVIIDLQLFVDRFNRNSCEKIANYIKQHYQIYLPMIMLFMGVLSGTSFLMDLSIFTQITFTVTFSVTLLDYFVRQCICTFHLNEKATKIMYTFDYIKYASIAFLPYNNNGGICTYLINGVYLLWHLYIFISMWRTNQYFPN